MAQNVTHTFASGKADGADATLVRPSNWNAAHTIPAGTAALPAIVPNSGVVDATSGIWWPAANTVAISTNATEAVRWASDQRMTCAGNVTISGIGPHAFGGVTNAAIQLFLGGAFPSANNPLALSLQSSLTAGSGGTTEAVILRVSGNTITTAAAAFTLADAAAAIFSPPTLSLGAGSAITNASTLKVSGAPTGATNNYALWTVSGNVALGTTSGIVSIGTTVLTSAAAGDAVLANAKFLRSVNAAGTDTIPLINLDASNRVVLASGNSSDILWGKALVALGGGVAPTLGTIGGFGPATAAQNSWMRAVDNTGATFWVPVWK